MARGRAIHEWGRVSRTLSCSYDARALWGRILGGPEDEVLHQRLRLGGVVAEDGPGIGAEEARRGVQRQIEDAAFADSGHADGGDGLADLLRRVEAELGGPDVFHAFE